MGNADRLMTEIVRRPGSTDGELRVATGVEPHQQVNQICIRLAGQGRIVRRRRPDGRIGNFPAEARSGLVGSAGEPPASVAAVASRLRSWPARRRLPASLEATPLPAPGASVIVVPCSKAKRGGGVPGQRPVGIAGRLPAPMRDALESNRAARAAAVELDESRLLPAVTQYDGHLYQTAGSAMREAAQNGQPILVMSGFYGVIGALDPIGTYERAMHAADWPGEVLEGALVESVLAHGRSDVVVFCSRSTAYATVVRRVRWGQAGLHCWMVSPDAAGQGGAQRSVPTATGEAIVAFLDGHLDPGWTSSDGLALTIEELT